MAFVDDEVGDWFDDNAPPVSTTQPVDEDRRVLLPAPGAGSRPAPAGRAYTAEESDFLRRNPGDEGRMAAALTNYTGNRRFDSQDESKYDTHGNYIGGPLAAQSSGRSGQGGQSGYSGSYAPSAPLSMAEINSQIGNAPQSIQPFTGEFNYADFVAPEQRAPSYASFTPTTEADMQADGGWKIRMKEAQDAIERSAAASGSYLTPNTMQNITRSSQDYASNEFGNVDTRRFRNWGAGYDRLANEDATAFGNAANTYGMNRGNQQSLFDTKRSIFDTNENNRFNSQSANRGMDFGILTGNRNFGLANQNMDLANRQFDYSKVSGDRNFGLAQLTADRGFDFQNRQLNQQGQQWGQNFDFTKNRDAFDRNRTTYRDEYDMWNERDNEEQRRREFLVTSGRPT